MTQPLLAEELDGEDPLWTLFIDYLDDVTEHLAADEGDHRPRNVFINAIASTRIRFATSSVSPRNLSTPAVARYLEIKVELARAADQWLVSRGLLTAERQPARNGVALELATEPGGES